MRKRVAFTLIELLVVIAIIALLMAVVMPSLSAAKRLATGAVCLANENQLGKVWFLFSEDHNGNLVDAQPEPASRYNGEHDYGDGIGTGYNFTAPPLDTNYTTSNDTECYSLQGRIRGFQTGALWPYFEDPKLYHCPGDKRSAKDEERYGYRTYSIGGVYSRYAIADLTSTSTWEGNVAVTKFSRIVNTGSKIVWIEEMDLEQYFNNNTWNIFLTSPRIWYDPVAVWHGDSSTFGFADGHAEKHKWVNELTREMGNFGIQMDNSDGSQQKIETVPDGEEEDYEWFISHYIPGRIPAELKSRMP